MTDMELADVLANCPFHTDAGSPAIYRKVPEVIAGIIIAALRRAPERPPSGEMVMLEKLLQASENMRHGGYRDALVAAYDGWAHEARALLSAAEAEGRKG